jgi:hypothetical protein
MQMRASQEQLDRQRAGEQIMTENGFIMDPCGPTCDWVCAKLILEGLERELAVRAAHAAAGAARLPVILAAPVDALVARPPVRIMKATHS